MQVDRKIKTETVGKEVWVIVLLVICCQLLLMVYIGVQKKGYFVDEIWSYGLSNSYYLPKIEHSGIYEKDEYISPSFFEDFLEVTDEDAFKYDSVFYNQANDIHPPLYYCVLHTISSFFPYTFSKWYGLIPNYLFYLIAAVLLFLLGKKLYHNNYVAIIPVLVWGCSTQTLSHVVMLRMYIMMCVFSLADSLVHIDIYLQRKSLTLRQYIVLFVVNLLSFLTQYFHYAFAFFLSMFTVIVLAGYKRWKDMIVYVLTMLFAVLVSIFIFPGIMTTFLQGRGKRALDKEMTFWEWMHNTVDFVKLWQDKTLNSELKFYCVLVVILLIGSIYGFYLRYREETVADVAHRIHWFIPAIMFTVICTFLVITRMAPFTVDRYYFYLTPFGWLVFFYFVDWFGTNRRQTLIVAIISILVICVFNFRGNWQSRVMYLFPQQENYRNILEKHSGDSCLYIVTDKGREYTVTESAPVMKYFSEIKLIDQSLKPIADRDIHDTYPEIIVFVDSLGGKEENARRTIDQVIDATRYTEGDLITKGSGIWWEYNEETFVYCLH